MDEKDNIPIQLLSKNQRKPAFYSSEIPSYANVEVGYGTTELGILMLWADFWSARW